MALCVASRPIVPCADQPAILACLGWQMAGYEGNSRPIRHRLAQTQPAALLRTSVARSSDPPSSTREPPCQPRREGRHERSCARAGFGVFSYAGTLSITVVADADLAGDLPGLTALLQDELDELSAA
jgi:hypothetical protein